MPDYQRYFVVSPDLNYGNGTRVASLGAMRNALMRQEYRHAWTLVISIHGAENMLSTRGNTVRVPGAPGTYQAADIQEIFSNQPPRGRRGYTAWRDQYGPSHVVLCACQVNVGFERVILSALLKAGSTQTAQGLGPGCRPGPRLQSFTYDYSGPRGTTQYTIRRRADFRSIPNAQIQVDGAVMPAREHARRLFLEQLRQWNRDYGYFGAPSVIEARLEHYYFEEEPRGAWVIVEVTYNRSPIATASGQSVSFHNRAYATSSLGVCHNVDALPARRPGTVVPP